jgi:hypothetical protein
VAICINEDGIGEYFDSYRNPLLHKEFFASFIEDLLLINNITEVMVENYNFNTVWHIFDLSIHSIHNLVYFNNPLRCNKIPLSRKVAAKIEANYEMSRNLR